MTRTSATYSNRPLSSILGGMLVLLLVALAAPGRVAAQPQPVQSVIEQGRAAGADAALMQTVATRAEEAGLDAATTADLLRPAAALAEADLPATPLLTKTLEGLAKQVPVARLQPVQQQIQQHTEQAGALAANWMERAEGAASRGDANGAGRAALITSITEAQQQDVPIENVRQFLDQVSDGVTGRSVSVRAIAVAVSVMPDLPGMTGDRPTASTRLLIAALDSGFDAASMRRLPEALEQARRQSQRPPAAIARSTAQAIAQGTPATAVLQGLFQGAATGQDLSERGRSADTTPPGQGKPPGAGAGGPPDGRGPGDDNPGGGSGDNPGNGDGP